MDKEKTIKLLAELHEENRSDTSHLREIFNEIEAAISDGVKRTAIVEALNISGLNITLRSFDQIMYRIRHEKIKPVKASATVVKNLPPTETKNKPGVFVFNSNPDPKDLI